LEETLSTLILWEHARIEEMKAKAIETTPLVQVKPALPRLADRLQEILSHASV